jgi:hypothetical protein
MRNRVMVAVFALAVAAPGAASAQEEFSWYIGGGPAFGPRTTTLIMVGAAVPIGPVPWLSVTGEVGGHFNIITDATRARLEPVAANYTAETGLPVRLDRVSAYYGAAGVRVTPWGTKIVPFFEAAIGDTQIAIEPNVESDEKDIVDRVKKDLGLKDQHRLMWNAGWGVSFPLRAVRLAVGHRFTQMRTDDEPARVNAIYAALRVNF